MSNNTTNGNIFYQSPNKLELFIKTGIRYEKFNLFDLLFVKAQGKYIELHFKEVKRLLRISLVNFLEESFHINLVRIHKSYAINTRFIDSYTLQHVTIKENKMAIGRMYKENWIEYLNRNNKVPRVDSGCV